MRKLFALLLIATLAILASVPVSGTACDVGPPGYSIQIVHQPVIAISYETIAIPDAPIWTVQKSPGYLLAKQFVLRSYMKPSNDTGYKQVKYTARNAVLYVNWQAKDKLSNLYWKAVATWGDTWYA